MCGKNHPSLVVHAYHQLRTAPGHRPNNNADRSSRIDKLQVFEAKSSLITLSLGDSKLQIKRRSCIIFDLGSVLLFVDLGSVFKCVK